MTFKKYFFITLMFPLLLGAEVFDGRKGSTALLRPILFRSEFLSRGNLRVFANQSLSTGFDAFGFPKFNPLLSYKLNFWETTLAQTEYYRKAMLKIWAEDIANRSDVFDKATIDLYKSYLRGEVGADSLKNPILKSGEATKVHHARDGYELIAESEHKLSHTGGAKTYGYKYAKASAKLPNREIILTAHRWGKFVALDMAFSTIGLAASGESNWQTYAINAAASTTAGFIAWGIESLLITAFPLTQGGTPMFIGGCAINLGGPASWIATGSFILIKYAVMTGWKQYQIQEALAVEMRCKQAEKNARFRILKRQSEQNTEKLQSFLI